MREDSDDSTGPVTRSTVELIHSMGVLRPWEQVTADAALTLARAVDAEPDGAKLATLSRELRQVIGVLARVGQPGTAEGPSDPIAGLVDEVARKRRQRGA